jgi:acetate kinase
MACARLAHLGLALDRGRNEACPPGAEVDVSAPGAAARVLVIPTAEDWAIARKCWRLLREQA